MAIIRVALVETGFWQAVIGEQDNFRLVVKACEMGVDAVFECVGGGGAEGSTVPVGLS